MDDAIAIFYIVITAMIFALIVWFVPFALGGLI